MIIRGKAAALFLVAIVIVMCGGVFGGSDVDINRKKVGSTPILNLLPEEGQSEGLRSTSLKTENNRGNSPGLIAGYTTYDYQSNGRMNRQVDWRASEMVHFVWTKQDNLFPNGDRGTRYEVFDPNAGFVYGGGCDIHPRLGPGMNYSGYAGIDVDTENRAVIANHHDEGIGLMTTLWHDFCPAEDVYNTCESTRDVYNVMIDNYDWLTSQLEDLFWINPSFILAGIKER